MDADSSQILAMMDVERGLNLVIEGPPGTGKSQTITNLIAQCLSRDQKVLFVSEKLAALEVVKRRLDGIGLGAACLELHSNKANKKAVLQELQTTLSSSEPNGAGATISIEVLEDTRRRLNAYAENLHTPVGSSGKTVYRLFGELARLKQRLNGVDLPAIPMPAMRDWSGDEFEKRYVATRKVQAHLAECGRPIDHPLLGQRNPVGVAYRGAATHSGRRKVAHASQTALAKRGRVE